MPALALPRPALIGVVHLGATPGAPRFEGDMGSVIERATADARALASGGCDAIIVENFGDVPFFVGTVPPETVAAMALAVAEVRRACALPIGVNVLRNDARSALALCATTGAVFLRVNVHAGAAVTDQGTIEGRAAETLRARARLAPHVAILADVHVKHATPLGDESIGDAARDALERGLADGVIVTGRATGRPPELALLTDVRERIGAAPLYVGSGLDDTNGAALLAVADGAIVGTWLKRDGRVENPVDEARVARLRTIVDRLRGPAG